MSWTSLQPALSRALLNVELARPLPSQSLLSVAASFPELGSVVSFQKLGRNRRAAKWVSEARSWIAFFLRLFLRFFKDDPSFAEPAGIVRGRTALRCAAARAGGTAGPPSSPAQGSAGGYRGWRLQLRALLTPWGQLEVPSARGADLGRFIFLSGCVVSSSALAGPASVQTFLQLQVSLAGAGPHSARPGRPLARCEVGGAPALSRARRGSAAGRRAGPRAARIPPRLRRLLACGFPARRGAGMVEAWPPRSRQWQRPAAAESLRAALQGTDGDCGAACGTAGTFVLLQGTSAARENG
ncbi:unnamed protein product [Rangifer tarandus platyrhynchus]|uniref:Uncharacterized protein n=2 Tax=Rangifer tarandus platyrhynchus TaxID=3082113 RepID=A0ACB0E5T0_RANTA|nr:unnamed protein product [Rangifer tarandus platyrhynchus]CAI9695779.1 unnamed protein product [Rangifer tarandus platyrhynchus]